VIELRIPAVSFVNPRSRMSNPKTIAYSMTSKESNIQPEEAAAGARAHRGWTRVTNQPVHSLNSDRSVSIISGHNLNRLNRNLSGVHRAKASTPRRLNAESVPGLQFKPNLRCH
jgi:hypothetical protein